MTKQEAIARAKMVADERGWKWLEPIEARRARRWWIGKPVWMVRSNSQSLGANARIVLDDTSGAVVEANWLPR